MARNKVLRITYLIAAAACIAGGITAYNPSSRDVLRVVANGSPQDEDYHGVRESWGCKR